MRITNVSLTALHTAMRVLGLQPEGLISIEAAEKVQSRLTQSEEEE